MSLPNDASRGDVLTARFLNDIKAEVQKNEIVSSKGLSFNRTTSGTYLSTSIQYGLTPYKGVVETAINDIGHDLDQWWFAGVEEVSNRDNMEENVSDGSDLILRKPDINDIYNRLVMLAEPIPYGESGRVYTSSDMMITRVAFPADGSKDSYRYATIDTDAAESSEEAYLLTAAQIGPVRIIDIGEQVDDWKWCIIRFPISDIMIPRYATATSDPSGGTLTVKLTDSAGNLTGDDITVYDGGIA